MAKFTIDGITYEGTPAELAEMVREFAKVDAESKEVPEDTTLKDGDNIEIVSEIYKTDITKGKAYEVKMTDYGEIYFVDDVGDQRFQAIVDGEYRKVEPSIHKKITEGSTLTSKVDELDSRVTALEKGDKPAYKTEKRAAKVGERILITNAKPISQQVYAEGDIFKVTAVHVCCANDVKVAGQESFIDYAEYEVIVEETPAKEIEHNGETYTLVSRKAQAGDVVFVTKDAKNTSRVPNNAQYLVDADVRINGYKVYTNFHDRTEANVLVYEKKAPALKAGDYIQINTKRFSSDITEGRAYEVKMFDDERLCFLDDVNDKRILPISAGAYRKVEPPKPKTGDIVVITGNVNGSRNKVGDIGKARDFRSNGSAIVDVPGNPRTKYNIGNLTNYKDMRLATEAERAQYEKAVEDAKKPKLKVGDFVRVKAGAESRHGDIEAGTIVKVTDTDHVYPYVVRVDLLDGSDYDRFKADDLELVDEKTVILAKIGRKPGEFKKGDIVRYVVQGKLYGALLDVVSDTGNIHEGKTRVDFRMHGFGICSERPESIELVTPVESRVDNVGAGAFD